MNQLLTSTKLVVNLPLCALTIGLLGGTARAATPVQFDCASPAVGTSPTAINSLGVVTGYTTDASFIDHGFVRDLAGSCTPFDPTGSKRTFPVGINTSGMVAGWYKDVAKMVHGFVMDSGGTITPFDVTGVTPAATATVPQAINATGVIAGYYTDSNNVNHGFVRDAGGTITTFDPANSVDTFVVGINTTGTITGYFSAKTTLEQLSFVRASGGAITTILPPMMGTFIQAAAINDVGTTAGALIDSSFNQHGYVEDSSNFFSSFDSLNQVNGTFPVAINTGGVVVGYYYDSSFDGHGFVRDSSGGLTAFDAANAVETYPTGVNDSGTVVGQFFDQDGVSHGFLLTLAPECQPPSITAASVTPNQIWPPKNQMVTVQVSVTPSGGCGSVSCQVVSVASSEPIDAGGDWVITGPLTVNLMATRLGSGTGRVYTITVQCTDANGNITTKTVTVTVPHNH